MGKILVPLEEDLKLRDLVQSHVNTALGILRGSSKTKTNANYQKLIGSTLRILQNIQKLLNGEFLRPGKRKTGGKSQGYKTTVISAVKIRPTRKVKLLSVKGQPSQNLDKSRKRGDFDPKSPVPVHDACPTSAEKTLANSLIVRKILQNLDSKVLKSCRRVCRVWEEEATNELLMTSGSNHKGMVLKVKFKWLREVDEYYHNHLGSLPSFIDSCLKPSRRFPCSQFHFTGGTLSSPALLRFFTDFGTNLKFLQLSPANFGNRGPESFLAVKTLTLVLFKLAPNLQGLTLNSIVWSYSKLALGHVDLDLDSGLLTLPKLTRLVLPLEREKFPTDDSQMSPVVLDLLKAAPNLRQVEDPQLFFTRELVAAGVFRRLVKSLRLDLSWWGQPAVDRLVYFSQQEPRLEEIHCERFPGGGNDGGENGFPAILRSSRDTLKTIYGIHGKHFEIYNVPCLNRVKSLHVRRRLGANHSQDQLIVPLGHKLVDYFPNLRSVTCSDTRILENPGNSVGSTLVELESLTITLKPDGLVETQDPSPGTMRQIQTLYPNLKSLCLNVWTTSIKVPETIKAIFAFPGLESLEICMHVFSMSVYFPAKMDAAFTGLPLSLCKDPMVDEESILKHLEKNPQPSIRNMTKLINLYICMEYPSNSVEWTSRICTRISHVYAFDAMKRHQGLKVREVVREAKIY